MEVSVATADLKKTLEARNVLIASLEEYSGNLKESSASMTRSQVHLK